MSVAEAGLQKAGWNGAVVTVVAIPARVFHQGGKEMLRRVVCTVFAAVCEGGGLCVGQMKLSGVRPRGKEQRSGKDTPHACCRKLEGEVEVVPRLNLPGMLEMEQKSILKEGTVVVPIDAP